MAFFTSIVRIWDRKNKKMHENLDLLKDIIEKDNKIYIRENIELDKRNLTFMYFTGIYDSEGNLVYEKDLVEYTGSYNRHKFFIDDIRDLVGVSSESRYLEKIGSIYRSDVKEEVNNERPLYDYIIYIVNECHICGNKHVYNIPLELTNTSEYIKQGDYIKEGLTGVIEKEIYCHHYREPYNISIEFKDGYLERIEPIKPKGD